LRIPSNIIIKGQYTAGDEFVDPTTNDPYIGYYYQINENFFQGRVFNINASQIIKKQDSNKLLDNPATKIYSQLKGVTSQQLESPEYVHLPFSTLAASDYADSNITRYFVKKLNIYPIVIREVDKIAFQELTNSPLYQTLSVNSVDINRIDELDKTMPGLKAFLIG
jgi:hypothetical protein